MKKLLTITAVGAILAAPATAVQKCVALDASVPATNNIPSTGSYDISWTAEFPSLTTSGIGICTNYAGSVVGQRAQSITIYPNTKQRYCWCKMLKPAVSYWIYAADYGSDDWDDCHSSCAIDCLRSLKSTSFPAMRTAMFETLSY